MAIFDDAERVYLRRSELNGRVSVYDKDCNRYDGDWENGVMQGYGKLYLANGDFYSGKFVNNQIVFGDFQNKAMVDSMANGFKSGEEKTILYRGDFLNFKFDGEGVLLSSDGKFEGKFKEGKFIG